MSVGRRKGLSTPRETSPVMPLYVPRRSGLRVSDRTFRRLCRDNDMLRLERTARGELIVMAPAGCETGAKNAGLSAQLWNWNQRSALGVSFDSSAGFRLPNGATRSPDASWVEQDRWEKLTQQERRGFSPLCPDFVVELTSPSDSIGEVREKMVEYIQQGARLGWLIDPERNSVEIYRPGRPVEILERPATVSGEDVLPGFVLDLNGILDRSS